eukprot:4884016-Pleurochrysis_carterae.AAC.8
MLKCIKYWTKARKLKASKHWFKERGGEEEIDANRRKQQGSNSKEHDRQKTKRKGGAGKRNMARQVTPGKVGEGLMRDIGTPQYTWGDGSCWLWVVAGAMGKLEERNGPTENDIKLERAWRKETGDTVREQGLPMTKEEMNILSEGVQYVQGN